MKKINNKGITLVELIVSFALVGVAIIYFFQTLYTVKKIYATSRDETQEFVDKNYALRILDAYIDAKSDDTSFNYLNGVCNDYHLGCTGISMTKMADNIFQFDLIKNKKKWITLYKYIQNYDDSIFGSGGTIDYCNGSECSNNEDEEPEIEPKDEDLNIEDKSVEDLTDLPKIESNQDNEELLGEDNN